jgi:hypothetical protein
VLPTFKKDDTCNADLMQALKELKLSQALGLSQRANFMGEMILAVSTSTTLVQWICPLFYKLTFYLKQEFIKKVAINAAKAIAGMVGCINS